ncbi:MAG: MFS transporter [Verrucomicrobia bacterium]|jgi:MFS family permease|nr:MFS transporter [Verrucomicrobiota bacterium]OQC67762.1 MAG: L-galactonate transporter [Verrucomicrobia bacterium ADurb.Bin006]MDI9382473.1 MFS transporter [Verrucomicrobiota bacterium]NMD20681.1 MFS transporter [Verrucomicrobiota bacterium]HNV00046.1 MFS transporter [Verrucomicrobiota bacterium]
MEASSQSSASRTAWLIVALLVPVALLNYLDRQMLAAMKFSVMEDIPDIALEENWGKILALFKWVYAFLSPIGGYLADRFSRRHVIAGSLFVWSAVTWTTGHVTTYDQLLVTRAVMGVSEAFYIPAALALIADFHLGPTRSRAVGLHQMGIYAGVIIGGFSGYAADSPALGWRWAFDTCGIVGVLYAMPLFFLLRNPPRPADSIERPHTSPASALRELLGNSSFILLVLYFTLPALAGWVVRDWMPAILKAEFNIGQGKAGVSATLYWQVAAIIGAVTGGWLADRWMRRTRRGRIYVSAIGMSLIVPAMFGVGYAPRTGLLGVALAFLILFGLGWGFFDCNNMPILCQIARPELRATGYGIMNLVSISCGGLADWGFGILRDRQVPLFGIFGIFASAAVISVVLVLLIRPRELDAPQQTS